MPPTASLHERSTTADWALDRRSGESLAVGLGWFSIALGLAEVAAPHSVARFIGVVPTDRTVTMLRAFGAREIGTGLAILNEPDRAAWLWSRVAGDALDLATLGQAMRSPSTEPSRAAFAAAAVLGVTAIDILCARALSQDSDEQALSDRRPGTAVSGARDRRVRVHEAVTVNAPIERVQELWATLDAMPESLRGLTQSTNTPDERCIVELRPAPGGRGTEVRVEMEYVPRFGAIGRAFAALAGGDPTGQIRQDLRRFKQIAETGEVVLSEGPSLWRPAQPAANPVEIRHAAGVGV